VNAIQTGVAPGTILATRAAEPVTMTEQKRAGRSPPNERWRTEKYFGTS